MAEVSRHLSSREGHGTPQVTGQMTAGNGKRCPGGGAQKVVLADSALFCICSASQAQSRLIPLSSVKLCAVISAHWADDCSDRTAEDRSRVCKCDSESNSNSLSLESMLSSDNLAIDESVVAASAAGGK